MVYKNINMEDKLFTIQTRDELYSNCLILSSSNMLVNIIRLFTEKKKGDDKIYYKTENIIMNVNYIEKYTHIKTLHNIPIKYLCAKDNYGDIFIKDKPYLIICLKPNEENNYFIGTYNSDFGNGDYSFNSLINSGSMVLVEGKRILLNYLIYEIIGDLYEG